MKLEECKSILEREGIELLGTTYWYNENMFAFVGTGRLFILPDFNYDKKEKKWCTYVNVKAPYFKLTNKFIDGDGTEEDLMILINAFKKNQKIARIEDKKRNIVKDFKGE